MTYEEPHGKRQSTDANVKISQVFLTKTLKWLLKKKQLENVRVKPLESNGKPESPSKEMEDMKNNQMEVLELKNTF